MNAAKRPASPTPTDPRRDMRNTQLGFQQFASAWMCAATRRLVVKIRTTGTYLRPKGEGPSISKAVSPRSFESLPVRNYGLSVRALDGAVFVVRRVLDEFLRTE